MVKVHSYGGKKQWTYFGVGSSLTSGKWRQIISKVGGGGQTCICATSVRVQQALIAAGGPGGAVSPQQFFSNLVLSESLSE